MGLTTDCCVPADEAQHLASLQHSKETLMAPEASFCLNTLEEDWLSLWHLTTGFAGVQLADSKEAGTKEMELHLYVKGLQKS